MSDIENLIKNVDLSDRLDTITALVKQRLCNYIGEDSVPESLNYIVTEVSVARFNQIGSEGTSSYSVSGESMSWSDDLFAPFKADIQRYISKRDSAEKVKFI